MFQRATRTWLRCHTSQHSRLQERLTPSHTQHQHHSSTADAGETPLERPPKADLSGNCSCKLANNNTQPCMICAQSAAAGLGNGRDTSRPVENSPRTPIGPSYRTQGQVTQPRRGLCATGFLLIVGDEQGAAGSIAVSTSLSRETRYAQSDIKHHQRSRAAILAENQDKTYGPAMKLPRTHEGLARRI